ncbi:MAG: hypothetical protein LUE97_06290 [Oscillospiraceae bacterium]|nr:hypothetical protein [Oscillospiraceae bacterium]
MLKVYERLSHEDDFTDSLFDSLTRSVIHHVAELYRNDDPRDCPHCRKFHESLGALKALLNVMTLVCCVQTSLEVKRTGSEPIRITTLMIDGDFLVLDGKLAPFFKVFVLPDERFNDSMFYDVSTCDDSVTNDFD